MTSINFSLGLTHQSYRIRLYLLIVFLILPYLILCTVPSAAPSTVRSSINTIFTIAGNGVGTTTGNGGVATASTFVNPKGIWENTQGKIYITTENCIRSFAYPNGIVGVDAGVCGATGAFTGDSGPATSAGLYIPWGIAGSTSGVIYFGDLGNGRVRKINSGIITTVAGGGPYGDGGAATSASLNGPQGLAFDSLGQIFFSDTGNTKVRKVSTSTIISTIAGVTGGGFGGDGGAATSAQLNTVGLSVDSTGAVYICDYVSFRIRKVNTVGIINTIIGTSNIDYNGENLPGTSTNINQAFGVTVDSSNGDVYAAATYNCRVQVLTATSGLVSTFAGTGSTAYGGDGGAATEAGVCPYFMYVDTSNRLYITENGLHRIRAVTYVAPTMQPTTFRPTNVRSSFNNIVTLAGNGVDSSTGTGGVATAMTLNTPRGIWKDTMGTVYTSEILGNCVRKFDYPNGIVSAVAGVCGMSDEFSGDGGPATSARLSHSVAVLTNTAGHVFVADSSAFRIRTVINNIMSTYAGAGGSGVDGNGVAITSGLLYGPYGIWMDTLYQLYISTSYCIKKATTAATLVQIAGNYDISYSGDGGPATQAALNSPSGVFVDTQGVVYIGDNINHRFRMVSTSSIITTVVGNGNTGYTGEICAATSASVGYPNGIIVDSTNGDIYMACRGIVAVLTKTTGLVSAFAGNGVGSYYGENIAATSALLDPFYLVQDTQGRIVLCESSLQRVRVIYSVTPTVQPTQAPTLSPSKLRSTINSIYTLAGNGDDTSSGTGGVATAMTLNDPRGVWEDTQGTIYITETSGNCVRSFSYPNGIVNAVAGECGTTGAFRGDSGSATIANLNGPVGVVIDSENVYFCDQSNDRVRKVSNNIITTFAGGGLNSAGDGYTATSASLANPQGLHIDSLGQLFISDNYNGKVKKVTTSNIIVLVAGTSIGTFGGDGGPATSAAMNSAGIFVDTTGVLYICDYVSYRIRQVTTAGIISTIIGTSVPTYNGEDLPGTSANINSPYGVNVDSANGDIYVAATISCRVRVLSKTTGLVTTFAGSGSDVYGGDGGAATAAGVCPYYMYLDTNSRLFMADKTMNRVRVVMYVQPTASPTSHPSGHPSNQPSSRPSMQPSRQPTAHPTNQPTFQPTRQPTTHPTLQPSNRPTSQPSGLPTKQPTSQPSNQPSTHPTCQPSSKPTIQPSLKPSSQPSRSPSKQPSAQPTSQPSDHPTIQPTYQPSSQPTVRPSVHPSSQPTVIPSRIPSCQPSGQPSNQPRCLPTSVPSGHPSNRPSKTPSSQPTVQPICEPTALPSIKPSSQPSDLPSVYPSGLPSSRPSVQPSRQPANQPTIHPTAQPSCQPNRNPTSQPTCQPSRQPSCQPTSQPISRPSSQPTAQPSYQPTQQPSSQPTEQPSTRPISYPSSRPSSQPTTRPSARPTAIPSVQPSRQPFSAPSRQPIGRPTSQPTTQPLSRPSRQPSNQPNSKPSRQPYSAPSSSPSVGPTKNVLIGATLPSDDPISVIGAAEDSFKIVIASLPSITVSDGSSTAFSSIVLNGGTSGKGYVVNGNKTMAAEVGLTSGVNSFSNIVELDTQLRSVSVLSDVNGDGFNDLIIGDPINSRCYVLIGNAIGLTNMTRGFTIFGESGTDLTGWSVSSAGDVNNDTYNDIIIGAPFADNKGAVYVIYGSYSVSDVHLNELTSDRGFVMYGAIRSDYLGISVSGTGDVNKDGFDDIVVGSVQVLSYYAGAAYIIFGGKNIQSNTISQLAANQGVKLSGVTSYLFAGYSVCGAGDVNNDGYSDVLIGSSASRPGLISSAYIIFGSPTLTNILLSSLTASQGVHITGGGVIVSQTDNVNHDRFSDVLIAASIGSSLPIGLIVHTNISFLRADSSRPTVSPTVAVIASSGPTLRPSRSPSLKPTVKPTMIPTTVVPTSTSMPTDDTATISPTVVSTVAPTLEPSLSPTESPTIQPSVEPTEVPTIAPFVNPTESPTMAPSVLPIALPTTDQPIIVAPTRMPLSIPTVSPTVTVTLPPIVNFVIDGTTNVVNNSNSVQAMRYIVNGTGEFTVDPSRGKCVYRVIPGSDLLLTIARFNVSTDQIDVSMFNTIQQYSDLVITSGSVIITLPTGQIVHILNQEPESMSEQNFIINYAYVTSNELANTVIIVITVLSSVGVVALVLWCLECQRKKKVLKIIPTANKFLVTFDSDLEGKIIHQVEEDEESQNTSVVISDWSVENNELYAEYNDNDQLHSVEMDYAQPFNEYNYYDDRMYPQVNGEEEGDYYQQYADVPIYSFDDDYNDNVVLHFDHNNYENSNEFSHFDESWNHQINQDNQQYYNEENDDEVEEQYNEQNLHYYPPNESEYNNELYPEEEYYHDHLNYYQDVGVEWNDEIIEEEAEVDHVVENYFYSNNNNFI